MGVSEVTLPVFALRGTQCRLNGGIVSEIFTPQNGDDSSDGRPRLVLDTNTVLALWMFRDPKLGCAAGVDRDGELVCFTAGKMLEELVASAGVSAVRADVAAQRSIQSDYYSHWSPGSPGKMKTLRRISHSYRPAKIRMTKNSSKSRFKSQRPSRQPRQSFDQSWFRHRLVRDKFHHPHTRATHHINTATSKSSVRT